MKFYIISDDGDALTGLRLAGIEGEYAADEAATEAALGRVVADESIAVLLMTATAYKRGGQRVEQIKQSGTRPLIVTIPDRSGNGGTAEAIARYVREAVGIKID